MIKKLEDEKMLRHVFIINVKDGISDEVVEEKMAEMRAMKEKEHVIDSIMVGRTRGLFGRPDAVVMIVDLKDKVAFDVLIHSQTHIAIAEKAKEIFDTQSADIAQIEY